MFLTLLSFCLLGFLVGGIPFGYLVGRVILKDDIRRHGSGNIGATNVARVIGWKWGGVVLFFDALKGLLPTLAARHWCAASEFAESGANIMIATGVAAIIGHMYPVYLRLRGGKGVATGLGVVAVVGPIPTLCAFAAFAVIALSTRLIGLASMAASLTFGIVQLASLGKDVAKPQNYSLAAFSVLVPLLILWRHRTNIRRMLQGTEPAITTPVSDREIGQ